MGHSQLTFDAYVMTSDERAFELTESVDGILVRYQKAYNCDSDSVTYCATSIIALITGDTVTVYSPDQCAELTEGSDVIVDPTGTKDRNPLSSREIYARFRKRSLHYPFWLCLSCRYPNTVGNVNAR